MTLFYKVSRSFLRGAFTAFYSHEVYLPEGIIYPEAAIIAANHASFLDPPIVAISWPEPIHFLARKTLFEVPFLEPIISNLNAHPLQAQNDLGALKLACKLLAEGKKILIFPEGTRSKDGSLGRFKPGVSLLAQKAKTCIIPAYIHGSGDAWPRNTRLPRPFGYKTACIFGKPLFAADFGTDKDAQNAIASCLHDEIVQLRERYLKTQKSLA